MIIHFLDDSFMEGSWKICEQCCYYVKHYQWIIAPSSENMVTLHNARILKKINYIKKMNIKTFLL